MKILGIFPSYVKNVSDTVMGLRGSADDFRWREEVNPDPSTP